MKVRGLRCRVLGFRVRASGFGVWGPGCGALGVGFLRLLVVGGQDPEVIVVSDLRKGSGMWICQRSVRSSTPTSLPIKSGSRLDVGLRMSSVPKGRAWGTAYVFLYTASGLGVRVYVFL